MPHPSDAAEAWFDDLAEGVVLVRDDRVVGINRAACEMLGVARERATRRPFMVALRDHRLERAWRDGRPTELTLRGRVVRVVPIRGGLALRDVDEARATSEAARDLLAVLSHELRTPLTTVRSTLEALAYDDLPDASRSGFLARAVDETDRLVRLLNDLTLDVAPPRERSVKLRDATDRARAVLAPVADRHAVRLRHRVPDLTAWVDPDKLVQVLINLIENAIVHGPDDAEVTVLASEDGGWARIVVWDEGPALPADGVDALFAPRSRGSGATGPGTGLGLYVVRGIAERWGGRAWGRPRPADGGGVHGNEFGVWVPSCRHAPPLPGD